MHPSKIRKKKRRAGKTPIAYILLELTDFTLHPFHFTVVLKNWLTLWQPCDISEIQKNVEAEKHQFTIFLNYHFAVFFSNVMTVLKPVKLRDKLIMESDLFIDIHVAISQYLISHPDTKHQIPMLGLLWSNFRSP